jgi:hypothetical protein
MKKILAILTLLMLPTVALAAPVGKAPFEQVVYVSAAANTVTESNANDGRDYTTPKGFYDADLWAIPAGAVIEDILIIVDEAVVGPTGVVIGDDDDADGYITTSSTWGSTGLKHNALGLQGAYLRSTAGDLAGATVKASKYYSASGKEIKMDVNGTASAGKLRVLIRGYMLP